MLKVHNMFKDSTDELSDENLPELLDSSVDNNESDGSEFLSSDEIGSSEDTDANDEDQHFKDIEAKLSSNITIRKRGNQTKWSMKFKLD